MSSQIKLAIQTHAIDILKFTECRFTSPFLSYELDEYREWISQNIVGDMGYLERHLPFKENPELLLPGVKTAIVLAVNYKNTRETPQSGKYKIARYAVGVDYHLSISNRLEKLVQFINKIAPNAANYFGVDSRPIAERSLAIKSGIGFRGKNTMVIRPKLGSFFFIAVVFTTLELPEDPPQPGTCGSCTRCIDACPTNAISANGRLNPTACIGYQTVEQKTPMSPVQKQNSADWIFGCDICQEVCPFNHSQTPLSEWSEFQAESGIGFDGIRAAVNEGKTPAIPKSSAMFRSRKRILANITNENPNTV